MKNTCLNSELIKINFFNKNDSICISNNINSIILNKNQTKSLIFNKNNIFITVTNLRNPDLYSVLFMDDFSGDIYIRYPNYDIKFSYTKLD